MPKSNYEWCGICEQRKHLLLFNGSSICDTCRNDDQVDKSVEVKEPVVVDDDEF